MKNTCSDIRKSALAMAPTGTQPLGLAHSSPGHGAQPGARTVARPLGEPMNIRQVAELIGCSAWSVRQRHVPNGLPHFRSSPSGKLIFYRDQVAAWIFENQIRKG